LNTDNFPNRTSSESVTEKKPYKAPSFRFESVFEVAALACGKVVSTQSSCHASRKAS
jgi:hypothetical protein